MSAPLDPKDQLEEPLDEDTADQWDEDRIDIIGPNGNNGEHYSHLTCPSYPNCDISPEGCHQESYYGEWLGHRD